MVEFGAPLASIGDPQGSIRGLFHASKVAIGANDYTGTFFLQLPVQAPALSFPPLVGLGALLMVSAIVLILRRKGTAVRSLVVAYLTAAAVAWAAAIVLDGDFADWSGISPAVSDPQGDSSIGDPAEDILAGYAVIQGSNIFFRMDLDGLISLIV